MSNPNYFNIIMALGPNGEFSYDNKLPWKNIYKDMKFFYNITVNHDIEKPNIIIMGKNTFDSIGKPLDKRINFIISSKSCNYFKKEIESVNYFTSLEKALDESGKLVKEKKANKIFIIGGKTILENALSNYFLEYVYLTRIYPINDVKLISDSQLNFDETKLEIISTVKDSEKEYDIEFIKYKTKRQHQENEYYNLLKTILNKGKTKVNRTGIDTIYIPGASIDLEMSRFPLLTCKRVYFKGVVHELLFFISGKTQTTVLEKNNVNIWKGNTSREFLDKSEHSFIRNLLEGDMGNGYGFQWRHFGAVRSPNEQLEIGKGGVDQLQSLIDNIIIVIKDKKSHLARRLIMSAWNPLDLDKQALPPCHMMVQYLIELDKLHCCVTMRSNDAGCGTPFNIASYALLTYMICNVVNNSEIISNNEKIYPGNLRINMQDMHIYVNHLDSINELLSRPPRQWPTLLIKGNFKNIDEFKPDNFEILDYYPHPEIKMDMVV